MALINPELIKLARFSISEGWAPNGVLEKAAIVPPGGGDPSGGGGAPPGGGDPSGGGGGGGAPPGGAGGGPPPGMASPGAPPPGGDPSGGGAGGPPPGPMDPAALQQIVMAVTQATGGGAGGPAGKGKSPKDQLQAAKDKIQIHLLAQIASKLGVQVDPQLLVPPADPQGEQMAMQEMQSSPMMPGGDPNAQGGAGGAGGAPPPGGDPSGGGAGGPAGPAPMQPMDASQGPIGKAAAFGGRMGRMVELLDNDTERSIGQEYSIPQLRQNRQKAAARLSLLRSLARD